MWWKNLRFCYWIFRSSVLWMIQVFPIQMQFGGYIMVMNWRERPLSYCPSTMPKFSLVGITLVSHLIALEWHSQQLPPFEYTQLPRLYKICLWYQVRKLLFFVMLYDLNVRIFLLSSQIFELSEPFKMLETPDFDLLASVSHYKKLVLISYFVLNEWNSSYTYLQMSDHKKVIWSRVWYS